MNSLMPTERLWHELCRSKDPAKLQKTLACWLKFSGRSQTFIFGPQHIFPIKPGSNFIINLSIGNSQEVINLFDGEHIWLKKNTRVKLAKDGVGLVSFIKLWSLFLVCCNQQVLEETAVFQHKNVHSLLLLSQTNHFFFCWQICKVHNWSNARTWYYLHHLSHWQKSHVCFYKSYTCTITSWIHFNNSYNKTHITRFSLDAALAFFNTHWNISSSGIKYCNTLGKKYHSDFQQTHWYCNRLNKSVCYFWVICGHDLGLCFLGMS